MAACPVPLDALPPPLRKHADAAAPVPLRMMGAKALVPAAAPGDVVTLLYLLSFDDDAAVRAAAAATAEKLPDRIYGVALRDDGLRGEVLDWLTDRLGTNEPALELLLLNRATPDATFARVAAVVPRRLTELVRQNELRLLRHDDIIRQLCRNPFAHPSTVDAACEFCVRNGLTLLDVAQLVEAHRRVHGVDPSSAAQGDTAKALMAEYGAELAADRAEQPAPETPDQQQRRLTMAQRIMQMTISEKIKLATMGNRDARTLLLRDSNKLVAVAAVTSPRITDGEILTVANSRTANAEVLREIYGSREYLKVYAIRSALVRNPKVPLPTSLKLLLTLQEKDIRDLARDRNVPQTIQSQAKAWVIKKDAAGKGPFAGKH